AEAAGELCRGQVPKQLQQLEWDAARLADDLLADAGVQRRVQDRVQQRAGLRVAQLPDDKLRQPDELSADVPRPEDQANRLRSEAARNEGENLGRAAVEPLLVVHHAEERLLLRHVGQQAQYGKPDEEAIRGTARGEPERRPKRLALRWRQAVETVEHRGQQLMQ